MNGEVALEPYQMWLVGVAAVTVLLLWITQFQLVISWDKRRIDRYIASRGGKTLSIAYDFFGRGWLVHEKTRAYSVAYEDEHGIQHHATCRTAWLAGVYFTDDTTR